jgi:hypothetical protein
MDNTIQATVIQLKDWQYLCDSGVGQIGDIQNIPCGLQMEDAEYWAVPVKDSGIFTRLDWITLNGNPTQPTYDSFVCFRIYDKLTGYPIWVLGTFADYKTSCAVCCGVTPIPMPTETPLIAPCQNLCEIQNSAGQYQAIFALPTLSAGQSYNPYGAYNNNPFPYASAAGYANTTTLLAFLNSNWNPFNWTVSSDNLTLVATGGVLRDYSTCVSFWVFLIKIAAHRANLNNYGAK